MTEFKDILKRKGLSTKGSKSELVSRLFLSGPHGEWMQNSENDTANTEVAVDGNIDDDIMTRDGVIGKEPSRTNMAEEGEGETREPIVEEDGNAHARRSEVRFGRTSAGA